MSGQPRADQIASEPHFHSADSACLERIAEIPTGRHVEGQPEMVSAEKWWRCTYLADLERTSPWRGEYPLHEHGMALHAHEVRTHCEFPS